MAQKISTPEDYRATFLDDKRREKALCYALDIRKFEIDLYWKRATYFWTLLAATFAGYFTLAIKAQDKSYLLILISCLGLVLSTGWYLVNRGSKYWQQNWERHVDSLEDEFIGPLYKTTIAIDRFHVFKFWSGYPYSVSKVNQIVSLFITIIWLGLLVLSLIQYFEVSRPTEVGIWLLIATTVIFLVLLFTCGLSGAQEEPRRVSFYSSKLADSEDNS